MNNKVLIKLFVPEIDLSFDVFVPTNEVMWKIKKMLIKSVSDLSGGSLNMKGNYILVDKLTNEVIPNNTTLYNTNIRNAYELILIQEKDGNGPLIQLKEPDANEGIESGSTGFQKELEVIIPK